MSTKRSRENLSPMAERHYVQGNRSDTDYRAKSSGCCGCHPAAHDDFVGCLVCGCQHGITHDSERLAAQPIYRGEAMRLLGCASQGDKMKRALRRLGIRFRGWELNREWAVSVGEFRQLQAIMDTRQAKRRQHMGGMA